MATTEDRLCALGVLMARDRFGQCGQYLVQYAVLLAAVSLAIMFAARTVSQSFNSRASALEASGIIF